MGAMPTDAGVCESHGTSESQAHAHMCTRAHTYPDTDTHSTQIHTQALGVLLYVLVFGKLPFDGESKLSILFGKYSLPPGKPAVLVDLIKELLVTDPEKRPDITHVCASCMPFLVHLCVY